MPVIALSINTGDIEPGPQAQMHMPSTYSVSVSIEDARYAWTWTRGSCWKLEYCCPPLTIMSASMNPLVDFSIFPHELLTQSQVIFLQISQPSGAYIVESWAAFQQLTTKILTKVFLLWKYLWEFNSLFLDILKCFGKLWDVWTMARNS